MTPEEAVAKIDALAGGDPEVDHSLADDVLYELAPPAVQAAYKRLMERCPWWATA